MKQGNGQLRAVHYLNQFFGQVGGEEKAGTKPFAKDGTVGPGIALQAAFAGEAAVVGTVVCGDSYFNENRAAAEARVLELIAAYRPDVVVAGPAFNAGRYGVACGAVADMVQAKLGIPAVTGMFAENPGVDLYRKSVYIVETADSAAGMRKAMPVLAALALKLAKGAAIGTAAEEGFFSRGIRRNYIAAERGAKRAVDMLAAKLARREYTTEYPMPEFDRVQPQPAVADLRKAKIALVTSGGIVPKGNPDRIEASSASKYGKYDVAGLDDLTPQTHQTAHGGYDPVYANADPDRVLPVDALRELEREKEIGELHSYYYTTVGNGTSVANSKRFAAAIAGELAADGVQAVILTST